MSTLDQTLCEIREATLNEARAAPAIFADLAKLEQYIAESYRTRSFIELLQNADDAGSSRFFSTFNDGIVIVANDGRPFDSQDIRSLCRSGASNKKRHEGTIGYRGIGFKSVASLATRVHVISGEASFTFSRDLTHRLIGEETPVPLIRMPHPCEAARNIVAQCNALTGEQGFTTFFVFEDVERRRYDEDLAECDPTVLLFLNNVSVLLLEGRVFKKAQARTSDHGRCASMTLGIDGRNESWVVFRDPSPDGSRTAAVAYRRDGRNRIVACTADEAVVHSFLPTTVPTDAGCKFNGDFSTDPSRTKIDLDATTVSELRCCAQIILEGIRDCLSAGKSDLHFGMFDPLRSLFEQTPAQLRKSRFSDKIRELLSNDVERLTFSSKHGEMAPTQVRLGIEWFNDEDAEQVAALLGYGLVRRDLAVTLGNWRPVLRGLGFVELSSNDLLASGDRLRLSDLGYIEVAARLANENRFNASSDKLAQIRALPILKTRNGYAAARDIAQIDDLDPEFLAKVQNLCGDRHDFPALLQKLGIRVKSQAVSVEQSRVVHGSKDVLRTLDARPELSGSAEQLGAPMQTSRWRRAETNLAAILQRDLPECEVEDVSSQNLGFDLLVKQRGAIVMRVEVKSVETFGDAITLTNNEYSCASAHPDTYTLAVVRQVPSHVEAILIHDPLSHLDFTRRCLQWQWVCERLVGEARTFEYP